MLHGHSDSGGSTKRAQEMRALRDDVARLTKRAKHAEELLQIARDAIRYAVRDHHLNGDECLCGAARSTLAAGLNLTEDGSHA